MRHLVTAVLCAFAMSLFGPTGSEATAEAASVERAAHAGQRPFAGKKKRRRARPKPPRNADKAKLKKAKDRERGFEL